MVRRENGSASLGTTVGVAVFFGIALLGVVFEVRLCFKVFARHLNFTLLPAGFRNFDSWSLPLESNENRTLLRTVSTHTQYIG